MAATPQAARLTEAHRLAQLRLATQTTVQALRVWELLDPLDLAGTTARWLSALIPILSAQRRTSAAMAANYLTLFRSFELGASSTGFVPVLADELNRQAATTSLVITGPGAVRRALAHGTRMAQALDLGKAESARVGARHVLNGGRETITATVSADAKALGWARATGGRSCAFCTMLAGRGAVYRGEDTANFEAHSGCSCSAEPIYRRDAALPAGSDRAAELYQQAKAETDEDGDVLNTLRHITAGT